MLTIFRGNSKFILGRKLDARAKIKLTPGTDGAVKEMQGEGGCGVPPV